MAAKREQRKGRKGIDLKELRLIMSDFIEALDAHINAADEPADLEKLKGVGYLLNQAIGSYVKLVEVGELEARHEETVARLDAIEAAARDARLPS